MDLAQIAPAVLGACLVLAAAGFVLLPLLRRQAGTPVAEHPQSDSAMGDRQRLYRQVLEFELDRDTGKLSPHDFDLLSSQLLGEAATLLRTFDGADGDVAAEVEREIQAARHTLSAARGSKHVGSRA